MTFIENKGYQCDFEHKRFGSCKKIIQEGTIHGYLCDKCFEKGEVHMINTCSEHQWWGRWVTGHAFKEYET